MRLVIATAITEEHATYFELKRPVTFELVNHHVKILPCGPKPIFGRIQVWACYFNYFTCRWFLAHGLRLKKACSTARSLAGGQVQNLNLRGKLAVRQGTSYPWDTNKSANLGFVKQRQGAARGSVSRSRIETRCHMEVDHALLNNQLPCHRVLAAVPGFGSIPFAVTRIARILIFLVIVSCHWSGFYRIEVDAVSKHLRKEARTL